MKREELMHFANWLQVASWDNMDVDFEDLVDSYIIQNSQVTEPVPTDQDVINAMKKQLIDHGFKTYL